MTGAEATLRFSRDKRGYEHFYLVQPTTNRKGRVRTRILYWFRTPPGVKVGRTPFDPEVRRAIEAQNPGVTFDWKRLLATPIPPPAPDVERWRERRRAERAERAARRSEQDSESEPTSPRVEESDAPREPEAVQAVGSPAEVPAEQPRTRRRRRRGRRRQAPAQPQNASAERPAESPPPPSNEATAGDED